MCDRVKVRERFDLYGIEIKSWAERREFSPVLVYQVLSGRNRGVRGESHRIAEALGIKNYVGDDLDNHLFGPEMGGKK